MEKLEEAAAYLVSKGLAAIATGDEFPYIDGYLPSLPEREFKIVPKISEELADATFMVETTWDGDQLCWTIEGAAEVVVSKYLAFGYIERTPVSGSWSEDAEALDFMGASSIDVVTVRGLLKEIADLKAKHGSTEVLDAVVVRLEGRRDAAGRTAECHPDPVSRETSKIRRDTYAQALNDIRILTNLV
jgi:hypothetical protein